MRSTRIRVVLACAGATGIALAASPVRAQDRAACLQAASDGQTSRNAHKLIDARARFRLCAGIACPSVVQAQCVSWLAEVERSLPTVVVTAKDAAGADLVDVKVTVDGVPFATKLDGGAVPLDPGPHTFHLELADGTARDEPVVVREGAKDQSIAVVLRRPGEEAAPAPPSPSPAPPPAGVVAVPAAGEPSSSGLGGMRVAALVVGGVGVAGIAVGAVFGVQAMSKKNQSDAQCPGGSTGPCSDEGVSLAKQGVSAGNASTVAFAVGLAGVAGGVVLWLTAPRPSSAQGSLRVGAGLADGGFALRLGQSF